MNWYSLHGQNQECSLNILELGASKILFLRSFQQSSLLHYLPVGEVIPSDSERDDPKKKVKLDELQSRVFEGSSSSKQDTESTFMTRVKSIPYIINSPMRFDLSILDNVDVNSIDFILLSSIEDVFLLPYLLRNKKMRARVFATVPVAQVGYYAVLEFLKLVNARNRSEGSGNTMNCGNSKASSSIFHGIESYNDENDLFDVFERDLDVYISEWVDAFTADEVNTAFERIQTMSYGQNLLLEGTDISIQPVSSGFSMGSALWVLEFMNHKVGVCNNAGKHNFRYPLPINTNRLKNSLDCLFLTPCLNSTNQFESLLKSTNASSLSEAYFVKFVNQLQDLLSTQRVNVVIPIRDGSAILDLLDLIEKRLASFTRHVFVISESAKAFVQLGNSNVEFLSEKLQRKIFSDTPSNPFSAADSMAKNEFMDILPDFAAFQQSSKFITLSSLVIANTPSIYFVVDSTFRLGNAVKLLKIIDEAVPKTEKTSAAILLTDPAMQSPQVIAPLLGIFRNTVFYTPLDNRIHIQEFCELLNLIRPQSLVYPRNYQEIQIFLENLRETSNKSAESSSKTTQESQKPLKINAFIYGNDQAVSLSLPFSQPCSLTISKQDIKALKLQQIDGSNSNNRQNNIPQFIQSIGFLKGSINCQNGVISISKEQQLEDRLNEEQIVAVNEKKFIIFKAKNANIRLNDNTRVFKEISSELEMLGFTVQAANREISPDSFKASFRHNSNNSLYVYVQHDKDATTIYSSSKDITTQIASSVQNKLNVICVP